jgi:DNA end-binding protein Ku
MPARYSWRTYLRLSLVSIPVEGYNAVEPGACEVHLNQLHEACHSRIRYEKVCPVHGQVTQDEIVSGYQYAKDEYVVIEPDELDKLRPETEKSIRIDAFVSSDTIDPIYLDGRIYYVRPNGAVGVKPFGVLYKAMVEMKRDAVGEALLFGKERFFVLRPFHGLFALEMLNLPQCMRKPEDLDFDAESIDVGKEERELAETLIRSATRRKFDLSQYHDLYSERLRALVEAKVAGREIVAPPEAEPPQVVNLMDALRRSVEQAHARPLPAKRKAKKPAHLRKKAV